jgi:predicted transposase YdaD
MMDFNCTEPAQMHYSVLKERTRYFKENEEGVGSMCRAIEEMRQSTLKERNIEIALQMLADHMPIELIAKYSTLTVEELTELANQNSN